MSIRRWLPALLLAAVIGASAGWYFGSPWWTLWQMKRAAEARDAARLSDFIDFAAVRDDVRHQLRERYTEAAQSRFGLPGALAADAMAESVAGATVRPEAIGALLALAPLPGDARASGPALTLQREGLDRFRLVSLAGDTDWQFVFERHGLGWKLSGVRLPLWFDPLQRREAT